MRYRGHSIPARIVIIACAMACVPTMARADDSLSPRRLALKLLQQYSPSGYYIISQYAAARTSFTCESGSVSVSKTDFSSYLRGTAPAQIAESLNTAVHEICHGYTGLLAYPAKEAAGIGACASGTYFSYYIGGTESILVKQTPVFPTREMAASIPARMHTLRFPTYVLASGNLGAQVNGIYGLLDELNAYYHGTKTAFDLLTFYRTEMPQTPETWLAFFTGVNGTYYAYGEFTYYISMYLRHAKANHPAQYREIVANESLKNAYAKIDRNYRDLIAAYVAAKKDILAELARQGYSVSEDSKLLWIGKNGSRQGRGNFLDVHTRLMDELAKDEHRTMLNALRP